MSGAITSTNTAESGSLSTSDRADLHEDEQVIAEGLKTFVEVGRALRDIRDRRLYREAHETFEDYLTERWGMHHSRAKQLIVAADVEEEVNSAAGGAGETATMVAKSALPPPKTAIPTKTKPTVQNERVARAVAAAAPKGQRADVWGKAVATAPKDAQGKPKITAAHVQKVAATSTVAPAPAPATHPTRIEWGKDQVGRPIQHEHVARAFLERPRFARLLARVSQLNKFFEELAKSAAGGYAAGNMQDWRGRVASVREAVRFAAPYAICPHCSGDKCYECRNQGWMPEDVYKRVPADMRGDAK